MATVNPRARRAFTETPEPSHRRLHLLKPSPRRRRRLASRLIVVGPALVLLSLLSVVIAQALMTEGQVQLTNMQGQVSAAQTTRLDLELEVAQEEQPSNVIAAARSQGLVEPSGITDIASVDLDSGSSPEGGASARAQDKSVSETGAVSAGGTVKPAGTP
jgi:cell division protein FtsL